MPGRSKRYVRPRERGVELPRRLSEAAAGGATLTEAPGFARHPRLPARSPAGREWCRTGGRLRPLAPRWMGHVGAPGARVASDQTRMMRCRLAAGPRRIGTPPDSDPPQSRAWRPCDRGPSVPCPTCFDADPARAVARPCSGRPPSEIKRAAAEPRGQLRGYRASGGAATRHSRRRGNGNLRRVGRELRPTFTRFAFPGPPPIRCPTRPRDPHGMR